MGWGLKGDFWMPETNLTGLNLLDEKAMGWEGHHLGGVVHSLLTVGCHEHCEQTIGFRVCLLSPSARSIPMDTPLLSESRRLRACDS